MAPHPAQEFRYQEVERKVCGMIESGALTPGEKLPSLRKLAMRMGLSISTVSQAYVGLEAKGLVEARPRSGYFVRRGVKSLKPPKPRPGGVGATGPRTLNRAGLIRQALEDVGRGDMLPLGTAATGADLLPGPALQRAMARALREEAEACLGYAPIEGFDDLRLGIARLSCMAGNEVSPDDIVVTNGCVEALYLALRALTNRGDTVLIQSPTYYCLLQLMENLGLRAIEVASDPEHGVDPAAVADAADRFDVRACLLAPNFNNPDGALMPEAAKEELVDLLAAREIPLVEDDVYGDLYFGPKRPSNCKRYDSKGLVLTCSSFSKTLAAGYRVGWVTPGRLYDKVLDYKSTTNVCTASPTQRAVAHYLATGGYERHLARTRPALRDRVEHMRQLVCRHFPEYVRVTRPQGGSVLWLELPEGASGVDFCETAHAEGIGVLPGSIFSPQDRFGNYVRVSCGARVTPEIEDGVRRLGVIAARMADGWPGLRGC